MNDNFRKFLIYSLYTTLNWMGRSDDWFKRSELVTRANNIIYQLGATQDAIMEMDIRYLVTDPSKLRIYRDKMNEVIDIDDYEKRKEALDAFCKWLHEIKLLKDDE